MAMEKDDDFLHAFMGKTGLEIAFADLERVVVKVSPDDLQTLDILFKKVQQRLVLDGPVGMAEDENMREVLKLNGLAMGKDDAGSLKEGPPFHLVQKGLDAVSRIIAIPVENPVEKTVIPDPGVKLKGEGEMDEKGIGGLFHQTQVKPAGVEVWRDGHHSLASLVQLQVADDGKAEGDSPEEIAVETQVIDLALDVGGVVLETNLVEGRNTAGEPGQVDKMDTDKAVQIIDEAPENEAVCQEGIDKDQVFFGALSHGRLKKFTLLA
jgi:hypothetical protein